MRTAAIVPSWMIAVNAAPGSSQPAKAGTMRRWPVLEIGRNSVSPWTMPRTMAWKLDKPSSLGAAFSHQSGIHIGMRDDVAVPELTRRRALQLAAAGALPLVLGAPGRAHGPAAASPVPGIRKPLPAAWFIPRGTNAEMRWSAMRDAGYLTPNPRFPRA